MAGLLDFIQGASNAAASNVSAPVDGLAWLLRKAGVPIPDAPIGGSDWMAQKGLTKPASSMAGLLGETVGGLAPILAAAKAPQIAQGLLQAGDNLAAPSTLNKQAGAIGIPTDGKAERMAAMGMEGGWYRGGPSPADARRTGPWYTKDKSEAENYAKRFGANADVREYAIPSKGFLNASAGYSSKLAHDVAGLLDDPYYGKQGAQLAKEFRTFGPNEGISGGSMWQALESRFGNDGAAEIMSKLGGGKAFKGVKGITGGDEALMFKNHPVRDANKAAFDPAKYSVDDIYGRASPGLLGAIAGGASGAALLNSLYSEQK